ncbi:hypothetical protein [uncultured Dysosmobacter sp.]|uniref:phage tail sheath family protein n=1 Tax=uncultured Dysosmobacter sp. TaxID=2591384 RepID=UPI00262E56B3|nr:hypothetical protein [uncultured Dysosmobacter sp.]
MANLGVRVYEQATSVSTPNVAKVGVPYFVGTAPVYMAEKPAKVNTPVLATSWDEVVEKLGFSYDWAKYTLCEAMYSHFQLFGCQPAIFCNVLDPEKMKDSVMAKDYSVTEHTVTLPFEAIGSSIKIKRGPDNYPSLGLTVTKDMGNAVLSRVGEKVTDCGEYTFYKIFDTKPDGKEGHLFVVEVEGKNYGVYSPKSEHLKLYFTLAGKQIDFVDGVKADGGAGINLSNYTGEIKVSLYSCPAAESAETYPTELSLVETYTVYLKNGHGPEYLYPDEDYSVLYDDGENVCQIELLETGAAYEESSLNISYDAVTPEKVAVADIVEGVGQVDAAMTVVGTVPDLLCAPGWSSNTVVAAVMATKAAAISGLFKGKAVIDIDSSEKGVTEYSALSGYKNKNNFVDVDQIVCWPMVKLGDYMFHLSTQLCGLMASVDTDNRGVPYESPSNKNLKMDTCCLADGTEVNLTWPQVEMVAGDWGVVTAVNFMDSGWVAKGNYTACFPGNTDVKDQFIPVSRMFDFIGNTLIRTFWPKQDKPLTTPLRDSILQTCNIWLGGLCGSGYLYGARCVLLAEENPLTSLLAGHITLHVYNAPPVPAQLIDFILEYDVSYMETALTA